MESVLLEQRRQVRTLPPLILHPFADASGPGKLVESSRASLMLQGLLPTGDATPEQLEARLLEGRYCELRMLFYVGKDLGRWINQCVDFIDRHSAPGEPRYTTQSFVSYLIHNTPTTVQTKLRKWGVADYKAIFSRAIALNSVFEMAPERRALSDDFIRNYYQYTDTLYSMLAQKPAPPVEAEFEFELYASGEYSRMLEQQWESDDSKEG